MKQFLKQLKVKWEVWSLYYREYIIGFVIGFNYGEARYLKEFLLEVLRGSFDWRDNNISNEPERTIGFNSAPNASLDDDEEDIW